MDLVRFVEKQLWNKTFRQAVKTGDLLQILGRKNHQNFNSPGRKIKQPPPRQSGRGPGGQAKQHRGH